MNQLLGKEIVKELGVKNWGSQELGVIYEVIPLVKRTGITHTFHHVWGSLDWLIDNKTSPPPYLVLDVLSNIAPPLKATAIIYSCKDCSRYMKPNRLILDLFENGWPYHQASRDCGVLLPSSPGPSYKPTSPRRRNSS